MNTELVKINPQEFGLTDETAANIKAQFEPMLNKMAELETEFNEVVSLPIEDVSTSKKAKELRLKYVKVRTGTAEIHKVQKAFYLNGGRFVDGWKNAQLFASQGKEEALEKIEKHFENIEKQRKEQLHLTRVELIREYVEDTTAYSFGDMAQDVFDALLSAKKKAHEDKIEAERKAEEDRIAREKKEAEEREAQRLENERLKKEAEIRERELNEMKIRNDKRAKELQPFIVFIRDYNGLINKSDEEYAKEFRDIKSGAEAHWEFERKEQLKKQAEQEKAEAERKRIEAEQQAKLDAERKERERIEAELQAKKEAELKAEQQRKAEEEKAKKEAEKLAKAPVKKQLSTWVNSFVIPEAPSHELSEQIKVKFEAFKKWALSEIESI